MIDPKNASLGPKERPILLGRPVHSGYAWKKWKHELTSYETVKALLAILLVVLSSLLGSTKGFAQGRRVALVIGNSKYPDAFALANPAGDARGVASALRDLDFVVIEKIDVKSKKDMGDALFEFVATLQKGDGPAVGFFFYAGHGMQVDGHNYLLPTEENFRAAYEVKSNATRADEVLAAMEEAGATLNVMVLDCCRDAPFSRKWSRTAGSASGLSAMSPPQGTLIAFSTKAGAVASDGAGGHSPYTEELLSEMRDRPPHGLELKQVFQNVARRVYEKTKQDPGLYLSGSFREYYLTSGDGQARPPEGNATANDRDRLERENAKLKAELAAVQAQLNQGKITDSLLSELKRLQQRMEELELQNRNRTNSMPETPAPSPSPSVASVSGDEKSRLENFIIQFEKSGESNDPLTTSNFYAARVSNYFGDRGVTKSEIIADRRDYIRKYPVRSYSPQSYTVLSDNGSSLSVRVVGRFSVSGSKSLSGVYTSYMEIGRTGSGFEVLSITQDIDYQ